MGDREKTVWKIVLGTVAGFLALFLLTGVLRDRSRKAELADWLHGLTPERMEAVLWDSSRDGADESRALTRTETERLVSVLNGLTAENLAENKRLAGITPEYGACLTLAGKEYLLNQADAPRGQTELSFQNRQWWIESHPLSETLSGFLDGSGQD